MSAAAATMAEMRRRLQGLAPHAVDIVDESHKHVGHAEAGNGAHLRLTIVAARFAGLGAVARHRLVYAALGDLKALGVHALAIRAQVAEEDGGGGD